MNLSISSSAVYGIRTGGQTEFLPHRAVEICAKAGFRRMEYNFLTGPAGQKPLCKDHWRDNVSALKETLDKWGMAVPYTHNAWFLMAHCKGPEDLALKEEMARRSVEASAMLGAKMMVVHTQSVYDEAGYHPAKTDEYNKAFFSEMGDLAARWGLTLAVENVFPIPGAIDNGCYPEELAQLMQTLNDPLFGICWDLGHANMAKLDHSAALRTVAPWLRHIHANDNKGKTDEHTLPGYGTVPWDKVMATLGEIGYRGDMTLSVRAFAQTSLPQTQEAALRLLHTTGTALLHLLPTARI